MPRLHVCSLNLVGDMVATTGARSLVTLLSPGTVVARPAEIAPDQFLRAMPGGEKNLKEELESTAPSADTPPGSPSIDLEAMRDGQQSFTGIAACSFVQMSLKTKSKAQRIWGMVASANYFDVLGVRPMLGRGFLP